MSIGVLSGDPIVVDTKGGTSVHCVRAMVAAHLGVAVGQVALVQNEAMVSDDDCIFDEHGMNAVVMPPKQPRTD